MEPDSQVKLLRVLEIARFFRVGGTRRRTVDVRLVAATNRDLAEAIKTGEFRQDLYYRINTITITLPPLRERREDVALLAEHFLEQNAAYGRKRLSAGGARDALEALRLARQRARAAARDPARGDPLHGRGDPARRPARRDAAGDARRARSPAAASRRWSGSTSSPRCARWAGTAPRRPRCSASIPRPSTARS